jgi:putative protein-disulfide isomerase
MENQNSNPLLCDIETGICEMPSLNNAAIENTITTGKQPIKVIY